MPYDILQIWGGLFYLLNKFFFSRAERSSKEFNRKSWRIRSWVVYLAGLPAWIIVFVSEHNWIAASVESGGAPAMISGLIIAWRGHGAEPKWLNILAKASVAVGLGISLYEYGGLTDTTQLLELGIAAGFLLGTYMMAQDDQQGYLWLMLGNVSCAALMGLQGFYILMAQQLISLIFVIDAFLIRRKIIGHRGIKDQA
ncbi:hypothetical protein [Maridesulfovibrio sp.]|uniref:hypothetical protein n=1 Tax=Maridesulfovibrio sp. TaxID=2795000 RepID=UPI002A18E5AC|nr:hypothetical protein [Maridesulfovibrio sp.]